MKLDYEIKAYKGNLLLIHTWHIGQASRDMEISAFKERMRRREVSHIEVTSRVDPVGVTTIYAVEVMR